MGLFSMLVGSTGSLRVFQQALEVAQNNVSNASTPGFAKQRLLLAAQPFDPGQGLPGGLDAAGLQSFRNQFDEEAVRRRQEEFGLSDQQAAEISRLEPYFDVTGEAGIPEALNGFFRSVSAWSVAPNDTMARSAVIERAGYLAARVRDTAGGLERATVMADRQIRTEVDTINRLAQTVRELNTEARQSTRSAADPGLDARLNNVLEELAEHVDFTTVKQSDGSLIVLLGGQTPLLVGDHLYEIHVESSNTAAILYDAQGHAITSQVSRGRLGAMLEFRNTTLPSFMSDLDRLAAGLADSVNALLAAGVDMNNQPGAPLFTYDAAAAAASLSVTSIRPEELAAAVPAAPGGNGNVLPLIELADSGQIDGASFTEFYGALARNVGRSLESAREDLNTNQQLLLQARTLRQESSGVSLDEEAILLIQFQRAYQATARLVMILNDLTETTINLLR
jgi:flagellar hook-associated protein 1 FlgK